MEQKKAEHEQAQYLYYQTDLTQAQIADLLDVNRKTIYLWIKEGNWRRAKYVASHAPSLLVEQYYGQLASINQTIAEREERPYPTLEEADMMRRLSMTLKSVKDNCTTLSDSLEVFLDFTSALRLKDRHMAQQFVPIMDEYIQERLKEHRGLNGSYHSFLGKKMTTESTRSGWKKKGWPRPVASPCPSHRRSSE